ncbi:MAG: hypothetical protein IT372_01650 [Polyangiaceae bacterium]|nr:hypothetical protein [Polyangiaceae bacterium]
MTTTRAKHSPGPRTRATDGQEILVDGAEGRVRPLRRGAADEGAGG